MARTKVTRKQLLKEPDEFLTISARLIEFGVTYKNKLTWVGIGFLVLLVAVAGIRYYSAKTESRAFTLLSQTMVKFATLSQEKGRDAGFLAVEEDFKSLIKKFSGTSGGKIARVMYADLSVQGGFPDTAIAMYQQALKDFEGQPLVKNTILLSLASALEGKKEYAAAADTLEILAATPDAVGADEAVYNLGRLYELLGDEQKSRRNFEKVLADFPDFMYADLVKSKLAG